MTPVRHERMVAGIPMRWEEEGAGVPVLLVHGIPTGPALWRHVMPLVDGARLIAWEMVGYAGSIAEGRGRAIGVAEQAEFLLQWLDAMDLERVVLVGHDLGGGVAHIFAVRHPERCAGLLLTNCVGYESWPIPSVKLLRAIGGLVRRLPDAAVKQGIFQMLMRRGHGDQSMASESLEAHWAHYTAGTGGACFTLAALTNSRRDSAEKLLERAGLLVHLDRVLSADDVKRYKPAREAYAHAAQELGVAPDEILLAAEVAEQIARGTG